METLIMNRKKEKEILICEIADTYNLTPGLTFGKEYTLLSEEDNKVVIINDHGKKTTYYRSRFRKK